MNKEKIMHLIYSIDTLTYPTTVFISAKRHACANHDKLPIVGPRIQQEPFLFNSSIRRQWKIYCHLYRI